MSDKCRMGGCDKAALDGLRFCAEHKDWKRGTMHPTEIDISNGALFLEIEELKRQVKWLETRLKRVEGKAEYIDMPIGGNH